MSTFDVPVLTFQDVQEWHEWLKKNHQNQEGVYVRFFKKDSGKQTFVYAQALDEALCFGWIDGIVKKYDEQSYVQRFTPRRKKSVWSKINIGNVERLIKEGRMKKSGLEQIEAAKADGRWEAAYSSPSNMEMPKEFLSELKKKPKAFAFFESLTKSQKYAFYFRLQSAKKAETKERRLKQLIEMLEKGEKIY